MVCYTTSEACTFVRMSLSLYEPHKVPLSVEQPLYLHRAAPTTVRERERKSIYPLFMRLIMYAVVVDIDS